MFDAAVEGGIGIDLLVEAITCSYIVCGVGVEQDSWYIALPLVQACLYYWDLGRADAHDLREGE